MSEFFLTVVNMSISTSWIVLAVLLLRLLLKKAPKWITVLLWGIVAVRLICPFTVESVMSLIPSSETINPGILIETPEINTGFPVINNTLNPIIQETTVTIAPEKSVNALKLLVSIFSKVWIIGIALMLAYAVISYFRVKRKIGTAVLLRDNIYQSETVVSPFVLGIIKPKIYLPFHMNELDLQHVIAHERAHIRRKDHWWKPFGFLLLTLHWFNPLMWLGYVLLCRDIELACDEKVVREMNTQQRADYSQALLTCSVNRRMISACPVAFGEVGVKDRVKSVLNYKKPAFWIIIVAIIASIVTAVCFLTNPKTPKYESGIVTDTSSIHTDYDGVYLSVDSINNNSGRYKVFNTVWHNDTTREITFGEMYSIEIKDGDEWKDVRQEDIIFHTIAYILKPHSSQAKSYTSQSFDISNNGTYRLCSNFSTGDGNRYITWVEFEVDEDTQGVDNTTKPDTNMNSFIEEQIIAHHHGGYKSGDFCCADFKVLGKKRNKESTTVYMWVLYQEYDEKNGNIEEVSGAHIPTVITVKEEDGKFSLVEYWEPRDGSYYSKDIREKFPLYLQAKAVDSQKYIDEQQENCDKKAQEYFSSSSNITEKALDNNSLFYLNESVKVKLDDNIDAFIKQCQIDGKNFCYFTIVSNNDNYVISSVGKRLILLKRSGDYSRIALHNTDEYNSDFFTGEGLDNINDFSNYSLEYDVGIIFNYTDEETFELDINSDFPQVIERTVYDGKKVSILFDKKTDADGKEYIEANLKDYSQIDDDFYDEPQFSITSFKDNRSFDWSMNPSLVNQYYPSEGEKSLVLQLKLAEVKKEYSGICASHISTYITPLTGMEALKDKLPTYFDLNTSKGLEVYIWQMAENSYSCGLLPGKKNGQTQEDLLHLSMSPASIEQMRLIIADYISNNKVSRNDVAIYALQMPYSSYAYNMDEAYVQKLSELFWSGMPNV